MTPMQISFVEQRMQRQWHELVLADQAGQPEGVLEQMYDVYIQLAEEFNASQDEYQRQQAAWIRDGKHWREHIILQ